MGINLKIKIKEFLEIKYKGSTRFLKPKLFIDNFGNIAYKEIIDNTIFLNDTDPFSRRVYCFINDISTKPICKICSNTVVFNANNGYPTYCSNPCRFKDMDAIQEVKRNTNLQKYGTTNVLSSDYGKKKIKETNIKKYGVDNYTKTDEYKNRIKNGDIQRKSNAIEVSKTLLDKNYSSLKSKYPYLTPLFTREEYKGADSYEILYDWKCNKCEKQFQRWLNNNYPLYCPHCSPSGSKIELKIKDFLDKYEIVYQYRSRKIIPDGKELDFYIPNKHIAIELNGLYWHSEQCLPDKNYHVNKTNECIKLGIQLIHIFEDELLKNERLVLNRLKHILKI